jgi:hypothetical protein
MQKNLKPEVVRAKLTPAELLNIFPEARDILRQKLVEIDTQAQAATKRIRKKLEILRIEQLDSFSYWFWLKWIWLTDGEELAGLKKTVRRIKWQLYAMSGKQATAKPGQITDQHIEHARNYPIDQLIEGNLRRTGKDLIGLCPFHHEKTPSLHIYVEQNRCWCYGCNQGGDPIYLIMKTQTCSFLEAVKELSQGDV